MSRKPYWELLQDPRWQRRRLEIFNNAGFKCASCGAEDQQLQVHHKIYRKGSMPWEYPDSELVCLCHKCHHGETFVRSEINEAMAKLDINNLVQLLGYAVALDAEKGVSYEMFGGAYAQGFTDCVCPKLTMDEVLRIKDIGWFVYMGQGKTPLQSE